MSLKPGVKPRLGAYNALKKWQEGLGFVAESLPRDLEGQDRGIAMDIALGVCRNISLLEHQLKKMVKFLPSNEVRRVLLIGLWQLYQKDKYAVHVAVDLTVELAKSLGLKHEVAMINAVLRRVDRENWVGLNESKKLKDIAVYYSHPLWLVQKWHKEWGFEKTLRRCKANVEEPITWYRINLNRTSQQEISTEFGEVEWCFDRYFKLNSGVGTMLGHDFFKLGKYSVQDPASYLMTRLLELKGDEIILDLCGAPGGKSALLLEEWPRLKLILGDLKFDRLRRSADLKNRLGLEPFRIVNDAQNPPYKPRSFDCVLIDAPCSNLGVLAKRPEAKWVATPETLLTHGKLQLSLLQNAANLVKPGGVLVYGTCSPEIEETENVVKSFLESSNEFELESARKFVPRKMAQGNFLRILPHTAGLDGFFGARLIRRPL